MFDFFNEENLKRRYAIDPLLSSLAHLPVENVRQILFHYRFFTHHYISDLALLISKMPFGRLRTLLAEFLSAELGGQDEKASHPALYDSFLIDLGCNEQSLNKRNNWVCEPLEQISHRVLHENWAVGVGLRGLGGECLCQVYLETAYGFLSQNPQIDLTQMDCRFWEIHAGKIDTDHRIATLDALQETVLQDSRLLKPITDAYLTANIAWEDFWQRSYTAAGVNQFKLGAS